MDKPFVHFPMNKSLNLIDPFKYLILYNLAKTYLFSISSMQRLDGTQGGDIGSSKSCFLRDIFMSLFIFTWIGFLTVSIIKL